MCHHRQKWCSHRIEQGTECGWKGQMGHQDLPLVQAQNQAPNLSGAKCATEQWKASLGNLSRLTRGNFPEGKPGQRVVLSLQDHTNDKPSLQPSCRSRSGRWPRRQENTGNKAKQPVPCQNLLGVESNFIPDPVNSFLLCHP